MPRIARPHTHAVLEARAIVRRYLTNSRATQTELARAAGVGTYTVSKLLSGSIKDVTPDVERIVEIANNRKNAPANSLLSDVRLINALMDCWDGTELGKERLSAVIRSLAPLLREMGVR